MRIVLLLVGFIFVLWIWRWLGRGRRIVTKLKAPTTPTSRAPAAMLACRFCGVHIPESEAIHSTEGVFCCQQHSVNMQK